MDLIRRYFKQTRFDINQNSINFVIFEKIYIITLLYACFSYRKIAQRPKEW